MRARRAGFAAAVVVSLLVGASVAAGAGTSRDPQEVRQAAKEIVSGKDFRQDKSPLESFFDWLADHVPTSNGSTRSGGGGGPGGVGNLITIALIVAAIVLIVKLVASRQRRPATDAAIDEMDIEVERRHSADEWADQAVQLEREGRYREAVRARYRELVARLVDDGTIVEVAGRTSGECLVEVRARRPSAAADFARATDAFERSWYGGRAATAEHLREIERLSAAVLASRRELVDA
jgi:hypothetical protein